MSTKVVSFNIESETQLRDHARKQRLKKSEAHHVTVSFKYGNITFGSRYVEDKELNGQFIKFFVDASRSKILWTRFTDGSSINALKEYRQIKPVSAKGSPQFKFSAKPFLTQAFPIETEKGNVMKKLQVQSCIVSHMGGRKFDYVEIR